MAKLNSAVEVLRFDRELMPPVAGNEAAAAFGLSSRLYEPFAGHRGLVLVSCLVYASLYVMTMWAEIALQYDRYAGRVVLGMPFVISLMSVTTYAALKLCWRRAARGDDYSLTFGFLILLTATLTAYGLSWIIMPRIPINGASTPQEIYVQNIGIDLALITVYLLVPFHFIINLQRELVEGRHQAVLKLLKREKDSVPVRHTIYLRIWPLLIPLASQVFIIWRIQDQFMRTLAPGKYRVFYVTFAQITWFIYFVLGVSWLIWYYRAINELKRECLIAGAFRNEQSDV